jgi:hypothetical protein
MYSGLLQTNQELAKAKELESNALSIGLEQGVKPLQGYLMGLANEEKERENQLKEDQKSAIDQMNMMADTSSLLGDFDSVVTADAYITKNLLNDIAKDESLNQYEKAAKYKEAVDKFNKKVSKFSADQELIAGYTGRIAKGNISGGVDITSDDYKIAKALSSGNFKISGDKYVIEGLTDSNVDSNRLKNLYLAEKTIDANATSGAIAALGSATTNRKDLDRDLREFSLNVGTVEKARELLVDGLGVMNSELKGLNLGQLQALIVEKGDDIATQAFIEAQPPVIKPSTAALMAKDAGFIINDAMGSGDFSFLMSKNAKFNGEQILDANYSNGILSIATKDKDGDASGAFKTINLNTANGKKQVGEIILRQAPGSQSVKGEALSLFNDSYNQPKDPKPEPNTITNTEAYKPGVLKNGQVDLTGYDFTITNLPTDTITDEEEKFGKRREYRTASLTPGSTISTVTYENSPLSSKKKLSEEEFLALKSDFEFLHKDYNDQNLAKFRQDKEGLSDKQIRLRQLDSAVALNIDNEGGINDSILQKLGVTDTEKRQLRGIKNLTISDLIKQLYVINADIGTYDSLLASLEPNRDFEN